MTLIERLRGGVYGLNRIELCHEAADTIEAQAAEIERLRDALSVYGWHNEGCPQFPTYTEPHLHPACICGFDAALRGEKQ
jgi:hypothetical protein